MCVVRRTLPPLRVKGSTVVLHYQCAGCWQVDCGQLAMVITASGVGFPPVLQHSPPLLLGDHRGLKSSSIIVNILLCTLTVHLEMGRSTLLCDSLACGFAFVGATIRWASTVDQQDASTNERHPALHDQSHAVFEPTYCRLWMTICCTFQHYLFTLSGICG